MIPISFFVPGLAKPAGSKRAFVNKKTMRAIVVDDCKKSADWKSDVRASASAHYPGPLLNEPLKMTLEFVMPRPKAHSRAGKNSAMLRDDAPFFHTSAPDATKLTRGVEDALTNVIWTDDKLVVIQHITKLYGPRPGVMVLIEPATKPDAAVVESLDLKLI